MHKKIGETVAKRSEFSAKVRAAKTHGAGWQFKKYLPIGTDVYATDPHFVPNALGDPRTDKLEPFFFDNADPTV